MLNINLQQLISSSLPILIRSALILLGGFVVNLIVGRLINTAVHKFDGEDDSTKSEREQRAQTLGDILIGTSKALIWGIVLITLLSEWGVNITPIITGAGIVGLAVGFGAQTLVKDVISGFFLLLENQYNKGDTVEIAKVKGRVRKVGLRVTILEDDKGNIYTVPNSEIKTVTKYKKK